MAVIVVLSGGVLALTTQSRLCLYHGSNITDHLANKLTKTTKARVKAAIPLKLPAPGPSFQPIREDAPFEITVRETRSLPRLLVYDWLDNRPPPPFS